MTPLDINEEVSSSPGVESRHGNPRTVDLSRVGTILRSDLVTIVCVWVAVSAISVLAAFLIPASYMSVASFIPPNSSNSGLGSLATQLTAIGAGASLGGLKNNGDVYVGILGSRSIADALISRFDLKKVYKVKKDSLAAKVLASRSEFEAGLRDGIVTIKVTDRSPERARDLANAYLDELHKTTGRLALSEASQRRLFFGEQLEKEKDDLANAEVDLKKLEERTGFIAPAGQTSVELQTIAQTRASIAVREVQLAALRQSSTDENPDVVRLRSEIADLQSQLSALERGNGPTGFTDIPKSKVPELELQYVRQEREVKYHEALFEMIAKQYESARLDESHDAPVLQVLDYGNLPDTRFGPPRAIISVVGSLLGALAGMAFVLFKSRSTLYIL